MTAPGTGIGFSGDTVSVDITSDQITDATVVGKAVLTAADAAAARAAIGAGSSTLALGTTAGVALAAAGTAGTATTAAHSDHVHPFPTAAQVGALAVDGKAATATLADKATVLATARAISITGGATAAAIPFDGGAVVALNVTALDASKMSLAQIVSSGGGVTIPAGTLIAVLQAIVDAIDPGT